MLHRRFDRGDYASLKIPFLRQPVIYQVETGKRFQRPDTAVQLSCRKSLETEPRSGLTPSPSARRGVGSGLQGDTLPAAAH